MRRELKIDQKLFFSLFFIWSSSDQLQIIIDQIFSGQKVTNDWSQHLGQGEHSKHEKVSGQQQIDVLFRKDLLSYKFYNRFKTKLVSFGSILFKQSRTNGTLKRM